MRITCEKIVVNILDLNIKVFGDNPETPLAKKSDHFESLL